MTKAHVVAAWCLAILGVGATPSVATTITIGGSGSNNVYPFGCGGCGFPYVGEYQQIYASTAFSGPITLTQIAFKTIPDLGHDPLSDTFTLSLGTTAATPASPGTSYVNNRRADFTNVFSGNVSLAFPGTDTFDFIVSLATPFTYDPAVGNLLLDANIGSNVILGAVTFAFGASPDTGRVYTQFAGSGLPTPDPNKGLLTQFTGVAPVAVPEPCSITLLATGLLFHARRWRNRRQRG